MHVAVVSFVVAEAVVEYNAVAITVTAAVSVDVSAAALFYFFFHLFNIYLQMNRIGLCCFLISTKQFSIRFNYQFLIPYLFWPLIIITV